MGTAARPLVALCVALTIAMVHAAEKRPNIWFVMADDLDADWKQDHSAIMPSLTKYLKKGGIYFENHVAAVPVCGPSRSSLLLSRFPHNNGYLMNGDIPSVASFCGPGGHMNDTVGNWLARAGYHTAFLGKHINNCEWATEQGWSHWGGLINTYDFYNATIHDVDFADDGVTATDHGPKTMTNVHQAQFLAEFTVEQATKAHKASKPFFIHTTPVMPHWGTCIGPDPPAPGYPPYDPHWEMTALRDPLTGSPAKVPISPCPSHKHRHDFDGQTNKHIASWNVSASGVVPAWMQNKRLDSWDEWREDLGWQNRSAACVDLDDLIAAVLEGFETLGVLNNTFVFFSSDNGYHLGEHRYVRGPGVPAGAVSKLPTNHLDIVATILELAGATHAPATPQDLDGLSFAAALKDTAAASKIRKSPELWRDFSFSEFFMNDVTWWNVRTVNSTHKFSFHYWCQGVSEVFNLLEDPLQLKNLAGDPDSEFGRIAAAEMLPIAMSLSRCSHGSCWQPTPATVPPIPANGTHLPCYQNHQTPRHPNWPTGSLGRTTANHHFQGWACIPNKKQADATVAIQIKIDGERVMLLQANISRPDLRGRTPCLGAKEAHGYVGVVPEPFLEGKHTLSAFAVNPEAQPVLLGQDSLCDGVSCSPASDEQEGHAWHAFEEGRRAWHAEQSLRAML